MTQVPPLKITTVLIKNECAIDWVVQGLEYDIAAQGQTAEEAYQAFERTIIGQFALDGLEGHSPAPKPYWQMPHQKTVVIENWYIKSPVEI